ncbi:glutamyl-tRNA reductase [Thermomicrobium sp. 4228-Ro]|uniref:glutamyl-tRNA reductase n=1 Tax=Thermomicrobium sp. 4228-Ro TaxID=2993937 RepID=UPI002248A88A|nr:glutamyl-tRNA reductase [Thermomicrobium sp. 4228-Ro]MCX2727607.1 glutamyl-tRNA reductase [Thermomicrobium sp. 4228-Ro]
MQLASVAITHRTAPIEVRERLSFPSDRQVELLRDWRAVADEVVLVVTCHRTELYWVGRDADPQQSLQWLATRAGLPVEYLSRFAWCGSGMRVVRHLMRVAAGLDSRVVGETQILGQVRRARDLAHEVGALGPVTDRLFSLALAAGREARVRSGISGSDRSLARVALDEVERRLGDLARFTVLVLGAGETGRLVVSALRRYRPKAIWWSNRSNDRFPRWAHDDGLRLLYWTSWPNVLQEVDIVFVTTGAPEPVLTAAHLPSGVRAQLIVDLSVPRNVDPDVTRITGVTVITVDDLPEDVGGTDSRERWQRAELVVELFVQRFSRWYRAHALAPELAATQALLRATCGREIARAFRMAESDPARVSEVLQRAAESITGKVLAPVYHAIESDPEQAAATLRLLRSLR